MNWDSRAAKATPTSKRQMASNLKFALQMARSFRKEEDGAMVILSLFVFLTMMLMAGLGIDTMRHEMERTHLQATLDSAVLAGAGQPQGTTAQDIRSVVEDYFDKNDMSQFLSEIDTDGVGQDDIETSLNATRVFAQASMEIDTYLLQLTGVDTLQTSGAAEAVVRTPKLEVSVVLDVSGSMRGTKLANLKTAARSFVTTMLENSEEGDTAISLVPFSWNVTPGPSIYDALTVDVSHDYSTCLRFDGQDYTKADINPDTQFKQQIFTAIFGEFDNLDAGWRSCFPDVEAEILPYSTSEADLHAHIDALRADGNTSAHIGMKWGAALLDPEFSSVVTELQSDGIVDNGLSNIPAVYGEAETLKVIVLMADGRNTTSYYFDENSRYRGPNSDLFQVIWQQQDFQYAFRINRRGRTRFSDDESVRAFPDVWTCVYEAVGDERSAYYVRDRNGDFIDIEGTGPIGSGTLDTDINPIFGIVTSRTNIASRTVTEEQFEAFQSDIEFVDRINLDWEDAWGFMSPDWFGDVTGNWGPWNDYIGREFENGNTKDARMQAICSATKNEGVVVYTIGYEISAGGNAETQLENCATSLNHYFPTDGADISSAFNSIASNVQNLRLTQ